MTSFHFLQEISHHVEEMRSETEPPTFVLIVELQTPWVHSLRVHSLNQDTMNLTNLKHVLRQMISLTALILLNISTVHLHKSGLTGQNTKH